MHMYSGLKFIVLPDLIDRQYAKFVAWYGSLVDSAILKSTTFDDFVDFMDGRTRKSQFGGPKHRTKLFREMHGRKKILREILD